MQQRKRTATSIDLDFVLAPFARYEESLRRVPPAPACQSTSAASSSCVPKNNTVTVPAARSVQQIKPDTPATTATSDHVPTTTTTTPPTPKRRRVRFSTEHDAQTRADAISTRPRSALKRRPPLPPSSSDEAKLRADAIDALLHATELAYFHSSASASAAAPVARAALVAAV